MNYENTVIGALMKSPSLINEVDLVADDFEVQSCKIVYQAIIDMVASNDVIDLFTVSDKLSKQHSDVQWVSFIGQAMSDCPSTSNLLAYSKILKSVSRNRKAKEICATLLNGIDKSENSAQDVDIAVKQLMDLSVTRQNNEFSISQAITKSIEIIEAAAESTGTVGIATGITRLDEVLGGFHNSDLYVIGARPAMGKTAFLLNLCNAHSSQCGIISAEQPAEQMGIRLIAINGRVNAQKMRTGSMLEDDYIKLTSSIAKFHKNNNIWINDKSGINITEVIRQARKWKHQYDIKAIYIDYIQRVKWTNQNLPKWEQVGNVVQSLKELARDLDIPVIALAQVNRDVEKRQDRRPSMGDLANSSEIEKEADVIMTLYRDEVYNEDTDQKGIMEVNVCKNRHGPTGHVKTVWIEQYMRVEDYSPQYASR